MANAMNCLAGSRSAPAKPVKQSKKRSRNPPAAAAIKRASQRVANPYGGFNSVLKLSLAVRTSIL
jgi:hypothetical protein